MIAFGGNSNMTGTQNKDPNVTQIGISILVSEVY